ncbi:hypothetical protein EAS62_03230 [Bradyrhizobium zhanjiangense]|uniref:Uncharacterized protein n=1 Tax=Bradyrhizobium zhanjiangense TaxID=1325107 RepID=A0ABY0DUP5_9BRAD|nr:hypothetical protein EAS62_03230 [Bradyrhizobium zhanjiangense]
MSILDVSLQLVAGRVVQKHFARSNTAIPLKFQGAEIKVKEEASAKRIQLVPEIFRAVEQIGAAATAFCRASRAQGIMPRKRSAHKHTGRNAALRDDLHGN